MRLVVTPCLVRFQRPKVLLNAPDDYENSKT